MLNDLWGYVLLILGLMMLASSCTEDSTSFSQYQIQFKAIDKERSNVSFANNLTESDSLNYFTYSYLYMGGGVSAGDINLSLIHI